MIRKFTTAVLLIPLMFLFSACSKDKSKSATASATIIFNGNTENFAGIPNTSVAVTGKVLSINSEYLAIELRDKNSDKIISMSLIGYEIKPGDFDLAFGLAGDTLAVASLGLHGEDSQDSEIYSTYFETYDEQIFRGQGTLHISSLSKSKIEGTFSMRLINYDEEHQTTSEMLVQNGKFNLKLITYDIE